MARSKDRKKGFRLELTEKEHRIVKARARAAGMSMHAYLVHMGTATL